MEWKDVGDVVAKIAPAIGGLFGGPVGAGIGAVVAAGLGVKNTPDAVAEAIKTDPEAAVKLQKILSDERVAVQTLQLQNATAELSASTSAIQAVNATMQSEAKADHWPTYSWRPFIGFVFGLYIASLFLLPLVHIQPVPLSSEMTLAIGGILGIASWFRGKAQANPTIDTDSRG